MEVEAMTGGENNSAPLPPGVAVIKAEFIDLDHKSTVSQYLPKEISQQINGTKGDQTVKNKNDDDTKDSDSLETGSTSDQPPPAKKARMRGRFRNTKRKRQRFIAAEKLCPAIIREEECRFHDNCKFSHDIQKYLVNNPPRQNEACYNYDTFGRCPFGVTCVFAANHLTADNKNIVNTELVEQISKMGKKFTTNTLEKSIAYTLSKRRYDFSISNRLLRILKEGDGIPPPGDFKAKRPERCFNRTSRDAGIKVENENGVSDNGNVDANKIKIKIEDAPRDQTQSSGVDVNKIKIKVEAVSRDRTQSSDVHVNKIKTEADSHDQKQSYDVDVNKIKIKTEDDSHDQTQSSDVDVNKIQIKIEADSHDQTQSYDQEPCDKISLSNEVSASHEGRSCQQLERVKGQASTNEKLLDEEGIRFRPEEKKTVDFRDKLYLAPLTTVGNLPFRRICVEYGADITCSEMATATGLLQGNHSEWALLRRHHTETVFGAQICASHSDMTSRATQAIMEQTDVDFIDINLGCPIDLFFKKGEGCALMGKPAKVEAMLAGMTPLMDVPVTVKMRTGIFENKPIALKLIERLKNTDVAAITVHGRSREQRYTRLADWKYIDQCAKMADPLPVIGDGDVMSYDDYRQRRAETSVVGSMIGRGALIKPWVFTEIKEQRDWDISSTERFAMLRRWTHYGLEHWGSDAQGVETTRRFLLEALSFLHSGAFPPMSGLRCCGAGRTTGWTTGAATARAWRPPGPSCSRRSPFCIDISFLKSLPDWNISSCERFAMLRRWTHYGLEHWGSDAQGVETTRRFLLEALSFLHRYIPVGLLERPPQRINEKPPHFFGRNDLETMMASRNCDDWIKISEMLLGKVPDGFEFVPKHKANAYS